MSKPKHAKKKPLKLSRDIWVIYAVSGLQKN
jgi:hypothetical protein